MERKTWILGLGTACGTLAVGGALAAAFFAIVTPSTADSVGWQTSNSGNAAIQFVAGPTPAPSGTGSLAFTIGKGLGVHGGSDGARALLVSGWDLPLRSLGSLTYSTYVPTGTHCGAKSKDKTKTNKKAVYITLDIDNDGNGSVDDTLIYEPAYNGQITCDMWQQWNTAVGLWYSVAGGRYAAPGRPLAQYVYEHPQAKILQNPVRGNGIALAAGYSADWAKFEGNADLLTISSNENSCFCTDGGMACLPGPSGTYDFEPDLVPLVP